MKHKIVRSGNVVISNIKSFRYLEQVNDNDVLRWGACVASCIEVTAYGGRSDAVATGETLTYYQTVDVDNSFQPLANDGTQDILIGTFTAVAAVPGKSTFSFTAYDNIYKLSKTFTWTPSTAKYQTYSAIFSSIATNCGVTFDYTTMPSDLLASTTRAFYSDGLTCRDVVSQFAEACGCFVRCKTNGVIEFARYVDTAPAYWKAPINYFISPTDDMDRLDGVLAPAYASKIPIVYKQDGRSFSEYSILPYTTAKAKGFDGKTMGAAQKVGDGNEYVFGDNIIVGNLSAFSGDYSWGEICNNVLNSETSYRGCEIRLFPFLNPFRVGQIVQVADPYVGDWAVPTGSTAQKYLVWDSRIFNILVMKMEINDSMVVITCDGSDEVEANSASYGGMSRSLTTIRSVINNSNGLTIRVDSGSVTMTANANSYSTESVQFDTAFANAPNVQLTLKSTTTSASAVGDSNVILSDDPSTTGFSMRLFNNTSSQVTRIVYWLAVGY